MSNDYSTSKKNQDLVAKNEALKKIYEHNRDYLSLTFTIPLGNTALKQVHTNQWLFTELGDDFILANWEYIAKALNNIGTRYEEFVVNRWYIEAVDISVEAGGKAEMKLTVNPFATSQTSYSQAVREMQTEYTNQLNNKNSTENNNNNNNTNAVAGNNNTIKNGWWGTWVTNLVKSTVGNETDVLKNCKTMHELFRNRVYYQYYTNMKKTGGSVSKLKRVWENDPHINCGDGANFLSAFYSCCGASTGIYLSSDRAHYTVKCYVNGKTYWCDQSGAEGKHNTLRGFGQTFHGYKGGTYKGKYV